MASQLPTFEIVIRITNDGSDRKVRVWVRDGPPGFTSGAEDGIEPQESTDVPALVETVVRDRLTRAYADMIGRADEAASYYRGLADALARGTGTGGDVVIDGGSAVEEEPMVGSDYPHTGEEEEGDGG